MSDRETRPADAGASLYARLGGRDGIGRMIQRFYDRVVADPEIGHFFRDVAIETLHRMQTEFFAAALGGPERYTGKDLTQVHAGRGITAQHYSRFAYLLVETLKHEGVAQPDIDGVINRLALHADDITGNPTVAG